MSIPATHGLTYQAIGVNMRQELFDIVPLFVQRRLYHTPYIAGGRQRIAIQIIVIPFHFGIDAFHQALHVVDAVREL